MGPLLVSVRDAAAILGLGRDHTYRLVNEGRLRSIAVGRKRLVPRADLEAFIEREADAAGGGEEAAAIRAVE